MLLKEDASIRNQKNLTMITEQTMANCRGPQPLIVLQWSFEQMAERLFALAPMMDLSDAHFRRMMRILSGSVDIFTEMLVDRVKHHFANR